jgi:hypothetical protein
MKPKGRLNEEQPGHRTVIKENSDLISSRTHLRNGHISILATSATVFRRKKCKYCCHGVWTRHWADLETEKYSRCYAIGK